MYTCMLLFGFQFSFCVCVFYFFLFCLCFKNLLHTFFSVVFFFMNELCLNVVNVEDPDWNRVLLSFKNIHPLVNFGNET